MNNDLTHPESKPIALVIDDSKDVHRLLSARLRNEDFEFVSAYSGPEGLEIAERIRPAIILLDLDMPNMDGFEVLRNLKENPALRDRPIIVVSGKKAAQDKVIAFDLGAMDYVTKPFDLMELRVRMRSALRVHQLLEMLSERAHVDGLTGLWNRAHLQSRWSAAVAANQRDGRPLSIAIFDADHFKSINDNFGHPAGDTVLRGIAKILLRGCRETDIACRFGGEEFILLMPDTRPEEARVVCERIRESIAAMTWSRHPQLSVTVSVGIAGSNTAIHAEPEAWIEEADKAMYRSKQEGRNRTSVIVLEPADSGFAQAG